MVKARAKAPEDWKWKSRHKGGWWYSLSGRYPLEDEQQKVNHGIWNGTQPEGLEFQAQFALELVGQQ